MESKDKTGEYDDLQNITRRSLLAGAAVASTTLAGCVDALDGTENNQNLTATYSPTPAENTGLENTPSNEEETIRTSTETSTATEESTPYDENTTETEIEPTPESAETSFDVERPTNFGWETEDILFETTGFCHPSEGGYLGALDAEEVENTVKEEHLYGEDPNNALNDGELIGSVDPLKPVNGTYAVDVDVRYGDEKQFYVQLVGQQDGGVYLNRQGAYEISELEWAEVFNEC